VRSRESCAFSSDRAAAGDSAAHRDPSAHGLPGLICQLCSKPISSGRLSSSSTASSTTLPVGRARFERDLWTWSMAPGRLRHARRAAWPRPTAYVVDSCFRARSKSRAGAFGCAVKLQLTRTGGHGCPGWLSLRGLLRRGGGARMARARLDRSRAPGACGEDSRISRSEAGGVAARYAASVLRVDWTPDDSCQAAGTLVTCARRSTQPREAPDPFPSSSPDRSGAIELGGRRAWRRRPPRAWIPWTRCGQPMTEVPEEVEDLERRRPAEPDP
jgi:hypothetical protein